MLDEDVEHRGTPVESRDVQWGILAAVERGWDHMTRCYEPQARPGGRPGRWRQVVRAPTHNRSVTSGPADNRLDMSAQGYEWGRQEAAGM